MPKYTKKQIKKTLAQSKTHVEIFTGLLAEAKTKKDKQKWQDQIDSANIAVNELTKHLLYDLKSK